MGQNSPVASNDSASGRQTNRRVELVTSGGSGGGGNAGDEYTTISYQRLSNDATANVTSGDAEYTTMSYQKLASDATTEQSNGEATYGTRSYQKLASDATSENSDTPAEYTTRTYRKLVTPATTQSNPVEAQYETRSYTRTSAPTTRTTEIPAEYRTVTKRQLVTSGGFTEWREVVCQGDVTEALVRKVQSALQSRGYDPGPVDNNLGAQTKAALVKFQQDNGLPVGQLDYETLRALGIR